MALLVILAVVGAVIVYYLFTQQKVGESGKEAEAPKATEPSPAAKEGAPVKASPSNPSNKRKSKGNSSGGNSFYEDKAVKKAADLGSKRL